MTVGFVLVSVLVVPAPARAQPMWEAELRAGYGLSMGTETDMSSARRTTPVTLAATGAIAINDDPELATYGGVVVETVARNTFGVTGGLKMPVPGTRLRLAAGAVWIYAPETRWGATASVGTCRMRKAIALCGDLQLASYFAGSAIADGHTVTQLQLVFGVAFDLTGGGT